MAKPSWAPAIRSAIEQSYRHFELLVLDDGSTDGSLEVLDALGEDDRVRVIRLPHRGPAAAIEEGLRLAGGEFVAFLDQDDLWDPGFLAAHLQLLDARPEIAATFCWFRLIDAAGRATGLVSQRHAGTVSFEALLVDFVIGGTSNIVMRRPAIDRAGGINPALSRFYDVDLCLRLALLGPDNICAIPSDLMSYRRHPGQMSRDIEPMVREWDGIIERFTRLVPDRAGPLRAQARSNERRYLARVAYEGEQYARGLRLLASGCMAAPVAFLGDGRNWFTGAACVSGLILPRPWHRAIERRAGYRRA